MAAPLRIRKPTAPDEEGKNIVQFANPPPPPPPPTGFEEYMKRLVKLIPGEVVGLYLVGVGVIPPGTKTIAFVIWAAICLGLVILVRARLTGDPANNVPPQWMAVFVSAVSYVLWVFTMPGPLQSFGSGLPFIGSLAVLVWTFIIPFFYRGS